MYNPCQIRMNLRFTALMPWMVLAGMAHGQIRSAEVLYTYKDSAPQQAYRLGDECFVPLNEVSNWGWILDQHQDSVNVSAEGHTITTDIRTVVGQPSIAVRKAISQLGGQSSWSSSGDVLSIYSLITLITVNGTKVHAEGNFAFRGVPSNSDPGTSVVDLQGARITDSTREYVPSNVQVAQYKPNVVRLSIREGFVAATPTRPIPEGPQFDYEIVKSADLAPQPMAVDPSTVQISPESFIISIDRDEEASAVVQVHVAAPLNGQVLANRSDPLELVLNFPVNAQMPPSAEFLNSKTISSITSTTSGSNTLLTLHLSRPMAEEIINERNGVTINLLNRNSSTGVTSSSHLAGKIVIVDPGHGGYDRGAHVGDVNEKDLNLPIGQKIAADLQAAGATVIITRSDDTFIPLLERSNISNRNHADLFISCHINSTGGVANQSGTITFYHKTNQISMYLAQCIQHEIAKVNGLPDLGVWSDTKIYQSGFSVLRNTTAPAVLIEMGFINHPKDRARMLTQDFQDSVAAAVVRGARVFFGETNTH
jgi:N-acetylmuramoyl-L-alanine amidase